MKKILLALAIVALLICVPGLMFKPVAVLGGYLVVWWFWIGIALGGLANVWMHNLTGGEWGEVVRKPLLQFARSIPLAVLLFLPLLLGMFHLFPWAVHGSDSARWAGELSAPGFKRAWLTPGFFVVRSLIYLAVWWTLAHFSLRPGWERSKGFSAAALILYEFTTSLAAVDWVMSLMPLWYSSVFGWLVGIGQMLGGMALGIVCAAKQKDARGTVFRDLGNLLLMYVLLWAYLAFSQFLIIWAENLPHEIIWYVVRRDPPWSIVAWILAVFLLFAPLLILLFRSFKQTPRALGALAAVLVFMQFINTCWLILPSLSVTPIHWLWALPATAIVFSSAIAFGNTLMRHQRIKEMRHV